MLNQKISFMIIFLLLGYSCLAVENQKADIDKVTVSNNYLKRTYTKKELDSTLKIGMSKEDVIKIFGKPTVDYKADYVSQIKYKLKPKKIKPNVGDSYIKGFSVKFVKNQVVSWMIIRVSFVQARD